MIHVRELSRHTVAKAIEADKTVICSPHELIAIVTFTHDVVVYRLNGQVAFTIKNPQDEDVGEEDHIKVARVQWSPDGRRLVVAWSDGTWRIHEAEKGDPIFESTIREDDNNLDDSVVIGMSWQRHLIQAQDKEGDDHTSTTLPADFPREVTMFDVTAVLPRLSALPAHGLRMSTEGAKFAHQASMDSIFASIAHGQEREVEVLLIHVSNGNVRVMLNGTSHVGTAKSTTASNGVRYASTTSAASHALLAPAEVSTLPLELMDLPLSELNGAVLHLTSHSTMQLSSLLQYVRRTAQCIAHDYTSGIALPTRLTKNISMTLDDNSQTSATLPSALLHLAMTGQFHPDLLEWLTDIVKDTGLKRWDTSISTMYSSIQTHLHSHVSPALDRICIVAARLRGLARLHQCSAAFTPDEKLFSAILDAADALRSTVLSGMHTCISEWTSWRMFSKWLKMQIEIASAGPNTKEAVETEEREGIGIDFAMVVHYIRTVLHDGSGLQSFVKSANNTDLTSLIASTDTAINAALNKLTAWQSRLFTNTRALRLHHAGDQVSDTALLPSKHAGPLSLVVSTISEHNAVSVSNYAISCEDDPDVLGTSSTKQLRSKVINARLYRSGEKLLCLEQSTPSENYPFEGLQLTTVDVATKQTKVLHHFDNKTYSAPEHIIVGGREDKEFCVVIGQGSRSWTVLDLHADVTADRMMAEPRYEYE